MGSGRPELGAVCAYASYLFDATAKWNLALAVTTPSLVIFFYLFTYFQSLGDLLRALLTITGMIYYLLSINAVYIFTLDISRGTSMVFLSQPLTRRGYVAAWMLASVAAPALAYALSFVVPLAILDATLLAHSDPQSYALLFLEGFTISMVVFHAGLLTKSPALVVALGALLHILLPVVLAALYSLLYYSQSPAASASAEAVLFLLSFLYPFRSKLMVAGGHFEAGAYLSALTAAALVLAALAYATRRLEVAA